MLGDAEGRGVEGEVVAADGEKVEMRGDGGAKTAAPVPVTVPAAPTAAEARVWTPSGEEVDMGATAKVAEEWATWKVSQRRKQS